MPSLILTTFAPFEQFAYAESSEGALFIFSPSKHAPLFAFWILYWRACWVYLVFETVREEFRYLKPEEASGSQGRDACRRNKVRVLWRKTFFFGNLSEKSFCSQANAKLILTS